METSGIDYDSSKYTFGELSDIPEKHVYSRLREKGKRPPADIMVKETKEEDFEQVGKQNMFMRPNFAFQSGKKRQIDSSIKEVQKMQLVDKQSFQQLQSVEITKIIPPVRWKTKVETSSKPKVDVVEMEKDDESIVEENDSAEIQLGSTHNSHNSIEKDVDMKMESEAMNPEMEDIEEETTIIESDIKNTVPVLPFDQHYLLVFFTTVESFGKKVSTSKSHKTDR